jgi:hypothetical protein
MIVQWIDVKSQEVYKNTIQNMYKMYAHLASKDIVGLDKITFKENNVKITDNRGWTDIIWIRKNNNLEEYLTIESTTIPDKLKICKRHKIPIYNPEKIIKGFHGETKYDFDIIRAMNLKEQDSIRIISDELEFINPIITNCETLNTIHGYIILTKSHYFNVNGFYLYND